MNPTSIAEKFLAADKIVSGDSTTTDKVESLITLVKGIDPRIDKKLADLSKQLSNLKNLQEGNVIELTVNLLPQETEKDKKRKRAIIFFARSVKDLKNEIERVKRELDAKSRGEQKGEETVGKIATFAKGPFGLITLAAIILVAAWGLFGQRQPQTAISTQTLLSSPSPSPSPSPTQTPSPSPATTPRPKIKVIVFEGRKIPLAELVVLSGPECTNSPREAPHYHAKNGQSVRATDGTAIQDPGGCGFGKVDEVEVREVETPKGSTNDRNIPSGTNPSLF